MHTNSNDSLNGHGTVPSQALAQVIEQARLALADGEKPGPGVKQAFIDALMRLIHDAMEPISGDPAFQAQVLRHRSFQVDEYASLSGAIRQDRQQIVKAVNALAHPGKLQHMSSGWQRDAMARLHRALPVVSSNRLAESLVPPSDVSTAEPGSDNKSMKTLSWSKLAYTLHDVLAMPEISTEPMLERHLTEMLNNPALQRLQRFETLATNQDVCDYLVLNDKQGPRAGSFMATTQGSASHQRGQAAEDKAAKVFRALVTRINYQHARVSGDQRLRVVSAMHAPSSIAGRTSHAKTEWDVVVLEKADGDPDIWDVRLLVEVKASADAAVTDFPRLLRGLELLARADAAKVYTFETAQGSIKIRGASLASMSTDDVALKKTVRYWCDTPSTWGEQVLNPANRMRLLSAPACVEFASTLIQGGHADPASLEAVWDELLTSPRLRPVLDYQPLVQRVQRLMIRQRYTCRPSQTRPHPTARRLPPGAL